MNKTDLIKHISKEASITKAQAESALNATLGGITESLKNGEAVQLIGFGSFDVKKREARTGRNPRTKEQINIPARKVPVFTPGKNLKDSLN